MAYKQLTEEQRLRVWALRKAGNNQSQIAQALKVHRSTISRELVRNSGLYGYEPHLAQRLASQRKRSHGQSNSQDFIELVNLLSQMGWDKSQQQAFLLRHHPELDVEAVESILNRSGLL